MESKKQKTLNVLKYAAPSLYILAAAITLTFGVILAKIYVQSTSYKTENISCTVDTINVNTEYHTSKYIFTCLEHSNQALTLFDPSITIVQGKKYNVQIKTPNDDPKVAFVQNIEYA